MAATTRKTPKRKTSKSASKDVQSAMRRRKRGTLKSGSGRKVTSKKQAIAIGLSEARKKGKKVAQLNLLEPGNERESIDDRQEQLK